MTQRSDVRVEVVAAKALARWKFTFAHEVIQRASQLAADSANPKLVTLEHYQQAAEMAIDSLKQAIRHKDDSDARSATNAA